MQQQPSIRLLALAPLVLGSVSGCSTMGLGDASYSCEGLPEGVQCEPVRQVYKDSVGGGLEGGEPAEADDAEADGQRADRRLPGPAGKTGHMRVGRGAGGRSTAPEAKERSGEADAQETEDAEATETAEAGGEQAPAAEPVPLADPGPQPEHPDPVRSEAQVLRIWHAPFEDRDGDLHMSGYSYTEVAQRRWRYGVPSPEQGDDRMLRLNPEEAPRGGMSNPMPGGPPSGGDASPERGASGKGEASEGGGPMPPGGGASMPGPGIGG